MGSHAVMTDLPSSHPPPAPVAVLVKVTARPESEAAALSELLAVTERWAREPGCLNITVLRDPAEATRFLVLETFASVDDLQAHQTTPTTQEFVRRIQRHLRRPPESTTWHVVSSRA
jgi:quinol monooxygenase YgiN